MIKANFFFKLEIEGTSQNLLVEADILIVVSRSNIVTILIIWSNFKLFFGSLPTVRTTIWTTPHRFKTFPVFFFVADVTLNYCFAPTKSSCGLCSDKYIYLLKIKVNTNKSNWSLIILFNKKVVFCAAHHVQRITESPGPMTFLTRPQDTVEGIG